MNAFSRVFFVFSVCAIGLNGSAFAAVDTCLPKVAGLTQSSVSKSKPLNLSDEVSRKQRELRTIVRTHSLFGKDIESPYTQLVSTRLHRYASTWKTVDLNQTILSLLGPNPIVVRDGPKIIYMNAQTNLCIQEDPVGHYFRIFRNDGGIRAYHPYLDLSARQIPQTSKSQYEAATHFRYTDFSDEPRAEKRYSSWLSKNSLGEFEMRVLNQRALADSRQDSSEELSRLRKGNGKEVELYFQSLLDREKLGLENDHELESNSKEFLAQVKETKNQKLINQVTRQLIPPTVPMQFDNFKFSDPAEKLVEHIHRQYRSDFSFKFVDELRALPEFKNYAPELLLKLRFEKLQNDRTYNQVKAILFAYESHPAKRAAIEKAVGAYVLTDLQRLELIKAIHALPIDGDRDSHFANIEKMALGTSVENYFTDGFRNNDWASRQIPNNPSERTTEDYYQFLRGHLDKVMRNSDVFDSSDRRGFLRVIDKETAEKLPEIILMANRVDDQSFLRALIRGYHHSFSAHIALEKILEATDLSEQLQLSLIRELGATYSTNEPDLSRLQKLAQGTSLQSWFERDPFKDFYNNDVLVSAFQSNDPLNREAAMRYIHQPNSHHSVDIFLQIQAYGGDFNQAAIEWLKDPKMNAQLKTLFLGFTTIADSPSFRPFLRDHIKKNGPPIKTELVDKPKPSLAVFKKMAKINGTSPEILANDNPLSFQFIPIKINSESPIRVRVFRPRLSPSEESIKIPFEVQATKVTQGQYYSVMKTNPSSFSGNQEFEGVKINIDYPVENVSRSDAMEFAKRLSALDPDYDYRLPTMAEFIYVTSEGPGGYINLEKDRRAATQFVWFQGNSKYRTHPVGSKIPNSFGIYESQGNVMEWMLDDYFYDLPPMYRNTSYTGPQTQEIAWGASWKSFEKAILTVDVGTRNSEIGFRLVRIKKQK